MAEVKWIKITTDIFDDEKIRLIEAMPSADSIIVIWFKLLTLAGKQNNHGVFMMNDKIAYTDEMLATIFRRDINTVRMALNVFEGFDMIAVSNSVYTIPNWEKHQTLDQLEQAKEQTRQRVARHREKQKQLSQCNVTVTLPVTPCNGDRIEEDKEEEKKEKKNKSVVTQHTLFAKLRPGYLFDDEMAAKMSEWLEYKTEIRQPYKERGLAALLSKVESYTKQYGNRAVCSLIDESMANGWKGIIWERLEKKPAGSQYRRSETGFQTSNPFLEMLEEETR